MNLAQGMLMNLIIQGVKFQRETRIEDIVAFRRRYPDELGRFRTEITRLVSGIPQGLPEEAVHQYIMDIYQDQFVPARNGLVAALKGSGIRWSFESLFKISFISMGSSAFLPLVFGLSTPAALLVGVGVSLVASRIVYSLEKEVALRANPFAYTLAIERELTRESPI